MNTYTKVRERDELESSGRRVREPKNWAIGLTVKIILMCIFIFSALALRIHYMAKIESLNKEAAKIQKAITKLELETSNLRIKRESLTDKPFIQSRIKNLGLRDADYRQVTYIRLLELPSTRMQLVRNRIALRKARERNKAGELAAVNNLNPLSSFRRQ